MPGAEEKLIRLIITIVLCYLIGSLPTAYFIARLKNVNIFEIGSGNMGGTNIARALGLGWGFLTAGIDIAKGAIAIFLAWWILTDSGTSSKASATTIAGVVVIVGHNWSLFATLLSTTIRNGRIVTRFRGGKGAATAFGTLLTVAPWWIILAMVSLGGLIVLVTRYVSLGVLMAFLLAFLWMAILIGQGALTWELIPYIAAVSLLIILRFRENIGRLLAGTERRLGERA